MTPGSVTADSETAKVVVQVGWRFVTRFQNRVQLILWRPASRIVLEWNSTFFEFSLIIEGSTEKVLQFIMPLKSVYNKNLGFIEHKCIFERYREVQTIKTLLTDIIFATKKNSDDLFRVAPYRLMYYKKMHCSIKIDLTGKTNWTGWQSTVDLLINVACFVQKLIMFAITKPADLK